MVVVQWLSAVRGPPEKLWNPQVASVKKHKNQIVQNMDQIGYYQYLPQPAYESIIQRQFAIKTLSAAGIISINNAGNNPAFPL